MTGACDSDVFSISGGVSDFKICGQNSGQHGNSPEKLLITVIILIFISSRSILVFYDVGESLMRGAPEELKININLNKRSVASRLWEIRISQIPFGSRAPSGCLQHFTGIEGKHLHFSLASDLNFPHSFYITARRHHPNL
jgi:hypothetical protein